MNMEFLRPNFVNTSTQYDVDSNTATAGFLVDRRPSRQYKSVGSADDTTQTSIRITFPNTVTVDHILLQNLNFKEFKIFKDGSTASTFALTSTVGTASSSWTAFSGDHLYLVLASLTAMTSLTIDIKSTQIANQEKALGQLVVSSRLYQFTRNPKNDGFTPSVYAKEIDHEASDGGSILFNIRNKMRYDLMVQYDDDRAALQTVYDMKTEMYFVPFPTCSSWNGDAFEMIWRGGFDVGRKPTTNFVQSGYDKKIKLEETPA